jgi:hypothetical protein
MNECVIKCAQSIFYRFIDYFFRKFAMPMLPAIDGLSSAAALSHWQS